MFAKNEDFESDCFDVSLEYELAGVLLPTDSAGIASRRFGTSRSMTKKEQESYITGLLDEWENRLR
jgi:hypothetical protein